MMKQIQFSSRGETVYGYVHIPRVKIVDSASAILLCHGFTGACHETSRLYVHLANAAANQGFYVLRADFIGSGNSDADFAAYTHLSGWVEDILSAVTFLQVQPEVNPERIGLLGISFGAGAGMVAAGMDQRLKAVVGWAPVIDAEAVFRSILGDAHWDALETGRVKRIDCIYSGSKFSVTERFVHDIQRLCIMDYVCRYRNTPLLLMQGDLDPVIHPCHAKMLVARAPFPVEYYTVSGEDHSFTVHEDENIQRAIHFFERVLCDK